MTLGQMIFYGGFALGGITVLLAIVFLIVKPKYKPQNASYAGAAGATQRLRNGYPTEHVPTSYPPSAGSGAAYRPTEYIPEETEKLDDRTELL